MNADYERARRELLERQTEEALAEEGSTRFKRHHAYIERLKGRDPGKGTELLKVLTMLRSLAPSPVPTSTISRMSMMYTKTCTAKLVHLAERGLIARQVPMQMGVGSWESTWTAVQV